MKTKPYGSRLCSSGNYVFERVIETLPSGAHLRVGIRTTVDGIDCGTHYFLSAPRGDVEAFLAGTVTLKELQEDLMAKTRLFV